MGEDLQLDKALEFDGAVDTSIGELVSLGLSGVLEKCFGQMREWAFRQLLLAKTADDRLKIQAYCACFDGLEKKVRRLSKSAELQAREITVT